jgi:hypothetical protein
MYAPEPVSQPQQVDPQRHLVDLQYEEISKARTAVLNREVVRMRGQGWNVRMIDDHLEANKHERGRSQLERTAIAVVAFLAVGYVATIVLADAVASLPISKAVFLGAAGLVGLAAAFVTRGQAGRERRVTVSLDGQGRPFMVEQGRDF